MGERRFDQPAAAGGSILASSRCLVNPSRRGRADLWIAEIVYFPLETELLVPAARLGARTLNGGGMAVFQAARAFELFTGVAADQERMVRHFLSLTHSGAD